MMIQNWKKFGSVVVVVLLIVVVGVWAASSPKKSAQQTIRIGYILPLTGNVAFLGEGVKKAALLALDDLKKSNPKHTYELLFEDDGFVPSRSVAAAQKLISVDHADVLVTFASGAGSAVAPIAEQSHVVHFGIASDPSIAKGTYNFLNWTPPHEEVAKFVEEAQKRNITKIAVFGQQISGIVAVVDELKAQTQNTDIQIVYQNVTPFGTKDFRTQIAQLKESGAQYVVLVMFSPELEILARQTRDAQVKIPFTAIESFELSDDPKLFEGLWYVNGADPVKDFSDAYAAKYSTNPSVATPNAYDIFGLIAHAVESISKKGTITTVDIAQALQGIQNYNGALGDGLKIDTDGLVVSKAVLRMIKDGKPVTL